MIDIIRHYGIFNPATIENKKILVVGCGAIGSKIVVELIKLGLEDITVYDFDKVESHNIANQAFNVDDIGKYKVDAIKDYANKNDAEKVKVFASKYTSEMAKESDFDFIFLAVDSIETRKDLVDAFTRTRSMKLIIETRMGSDEVQIYIIKSRKDYKDWLKTISFDKAYVETSACGSPISFGLISTFASALACNAFVHYTNDKLLNNKISLFSFPLDLMDSSY